MYVCLRSTLDLGLCVHALPAQFASTFMLAVTRPFKVLLLKDLVPHSVQYYSVL